MTNYEDFPCVEAVAMVTDYFEGALSTEDRAILERHLAWCDWCATYVDQLRQTIRLAGTLRDEDVPAPSWTSSSRRFARWATRDRQPTRSPKRSWSHHACLVRSARKWCW